MKADSYIYEITCPSCKDICQWSHLCPMPTVETPGPVIAEETPSQRIAGEIRREAEEFAEFHAQTRAKIDAGIRRTSGKIG